MQTIRGTKDILPNEISAWQNLYLQTLQLLKLYNYYEIRTPIIENTEVFLKSVGNDTDIVSKEMYRFTDQGQRDISLRPEGTASIARAVASNKLYNSSPIQRLWYMGPMFRYERPQHGRHRQFHQLGIECIGSKNPIADVEVISIASNLLETLQFDQYEIEINSLGTEEERGVYTMAFKTFMEDYKDELDKESQKRLKNNPLRILDSKSKRIQEIIQNAPCISKFLTKESQEHLSIVLESLEQLKIPYKINRKLVRGLDYYNHTTFEIISNKTGKNLTLCGGGRYSNLVKQFGGPELSGVGWAIGVERLLLIQNEAQNLNAQDLRFDIITEGIDAEKESCKLSILLAKNDIMFNLNLQNQNIQKQIRKAINNKAIACLIIGNNEMQDSTITIKWLKEHSQETIPRENLLSYLQNKLKEYKNSQ